MTEPEREPKLWRLLRDGENATNDDIRCVMLFGALSPNVVWLRRYSLPEELKVRQCEKCGLLISSAATRCAGCDFDAVQRQLADRDKRITELEAQIPPPLTEAELAELTRSSEKLYNAEARVAELESSNGYPLAAEWRGKCEAARAKIAELEAQLADALKIVARMWPNQPNLRLALLHVEQMVQGMKGHITRTAPASDKPEPPAQERPGDSHTSVRQELHDITSPGSESVTTAAGPRFPHPDPEAVWTGWIEEFQCDCYAKETTELLCDYTINHPTSSDWENERHCMELSSKMLRRKEAWRRAVEWRDKQKTGIVALEHANIEAITFESDDGEWVVTVSYTDATSDTYFSFAKAIEILTRDKQKAAAGDSEKEMLSHRVSSGKTFQQHIDDFLTVNQQGDGSNNLWGRFPLGCVGGWIDRATKAETDEEKMCAERDEVQDIADTMTSAILGEPIDWSDHHAKWHEAIDKAKQRAELPGVLPRRPRSKDTPPAAELPKRTKAQLILRGLPSFAETNQALLDTILQVDDLASQLVRLYRDTRRQVEQLAAEVEKMRMASKQD